MTTRPATPADAGALAAIYAPIVRETAISFELDPPDAAQMARRIDKTLATLPWLVATDAAGTVTGYAYASPHRERPAYRWSVDVSAYVHANHRGQGVGRALYDALLADLRQRGYWQAFAGIALPNTASIALHEAAGFGHIGTYRSVGYKLGAWHDVGWWQRPLRTPAIHGLPLEDPSPGIPTGPAQ